MKIGILTFYRAANFGGLLQAYAIGHCLQSRGHEIVYIEDPSQFPRRPSFMHCLIARSLRGLRMKYERWLSFEKVRFAAGAPTAGYGEHFDAVLVGSDQVWNSRWYGSPELVEKMFLGWTEESTKRIAYAASFGGDTWAALETAARVGVLLRAFDAISVRENSGRRLVAELSGREDVSVLLDPVLLQEASFYWKLFDPRESADRYVFSYMLRWSKDGVPEAAALEAQRRFGKRVISSYAGDLVGTWLANLSGASCVVTNSFHGVAFAILFHRPFVALRLKGEYAGMNDRVETLLSLVGLSERFVCADDLVGIRQVVAADVDWAHVDRILTQERMKTDEFFKEAGL